MLDAGRNAYGDDPQAPPITVVPSSEWNSGMRALHEYTVGFAERLLGKAISVRFVCCFQSNGAQWRACYGKRRSQGLSELDFNVGVLGKDWFDNGVNEEIDGLILHEFGHDICTNHADENYFRALTLLGARLKAAALAEPEWFRRFERIEG